MTDVTQILRAIQTGDERASDELLPLVYQELRHLAAQKLAHESPGQTLEATALVHEAYLRLVKADEQKQWDSRGHFFAAAAEAMRRLLVENARRKRRVKRGGELERRELDDEAIAAPQIDVDLLELLYLRKSQDGRQWIDWRTIANMDLPASLSVGVVATNSTNTEFMHTFENLALSQNY